MAISMKCPNCGGALIYDPESDKMKCDYCGGKERVSECFEQETTRKEPALKLNLDSTRQEKKLRLNESKSEEESAIKQEWNVPQQIDDMGMMDEEYVELNLYHCTSCGAQLMLSGTEASTYCSFCDSPTIVFERVSKQLRPQKIIPFKITEEQALDRIKSAFAGRKYIPKKIQELTVDKIRGIYMPFWLYDCYIRRSMNITARTHDEDYKYYRDASCTYRYITLDASLNLSNEFSQRLEPYNMEELKDFELPYLSGYYADKFDVPCDAVKPIAHTRCQQYLDKAIIDSCPHANDEIIGEISNCNCVKDVIQEEYQVESVEYALLPAYFVNLRYEDGKQLVIVNGQTGKVVADLPYEKDLMPKIFMKYAIIYSIIFSVISTLCMMFPKGESLLLILVAYVVVALMTGFRAYRRYKTNRYRITASNMRSYVNDREGDM